MASSQRRVSVGVSMPLELINAIDEEVGDRERSEFIRAAIRKQLNADNDDE